MIMNMKMSNVYEYVKLKGILILITNSYVQQHVECLML